MKKSVLFIFLTVTVTLFSQNSGVAEYDFYYREFSDKPKNINETNAREMVDVISEYAKSHKYLLKFNTNESLYYVETSMPTDGVNEFAYKFSKYIFSNGIFYQNKTTLEKINETFEMNELYLVNDTLINNWELSSEVKYIGKYKCYKATSKCSSCNENQLITVWFAPEIPMAYGPAGYGGTPGLILEVTKYRYTLRLRKLKLSDKTIVIERPEKGIVITTEELKSLMKKKRLEIMKGN